MFSPIGLKYILQQMLTIIDKEHSHLITDYLGEY